MDFYCGLGMCTSCQLHLLLLLTILNALDVPYPPGNRSLSSWERIAIYSIEEWKSQLVSNTAHRPLMRGSFGSNPDDDNAWGICQRELLVRENNGCNLV